MSSLARASEPSVPDFEFVGKQFARKIDMSPVAEDDRDMMREICYGIVTYKQRMPPLDMDIFDAGDHYVLTIKGWTHRIDDEEWFRTFLMKPGRDPKYDTVIRTQTIPACDTDDRSESIKIFHIRKLEWAVTRKAKTKKRH